MIRFYRVTLTTAHGSRVLFLHARNRFDARQCAREDGWTIVTIEEL
jgi:hypothetical protein